MADITILNDFFIFGGNLDLDIPTFDPNICLDPELGLGLGLGFCAETHVVGDDMDDYTRFMFGVDDSLVWREILPSDDEAEAPIYSSEDENRSEVDEEMMVEDYKRNMPASKKAVENLDMPKDDECTICMGKIGIWEKAKTLPCLHCYHWFCVEPWMLMRNTCPVCRYELPTDDPDDEGRVVNAGSD